MSSFDFALKDFFRKRRSNFPYLLIIILVVAVAEFLIYFSSSLGLNIFIQPTFTNKYYFSGGINLIYEQFNTLIQVLFIILTIVIVIAVTTTLVISKKRDIAIMKSLGTLPQKLYSFYLFEVYILFFIGFLFGWILGLFSFVVFGLIMNLFNFSITFQIDLFYTPIMLFSCIIGIFLISGFVLRKIGRQKIISTFSKDIPFNYDASKQLKFMPKWLTSIGFNTKIAVVNTIRKKNEFKRYLILFSLVGIMIFTLGLGTIVLRTSSQEWIQKSQSENIVILGHKDVIYNYSLMYKMFSDPSLLIDETNVNFTEPSYLFNLSDISTLYTNEKIEKIDERLINFYGVKELDGIHILEDGRYLPIGQDREGIIPIVGVNPENIIQNFEIEGKFFSEEDDENITIGDGLAHNFFDYALDQSLEFTGTGRTFEISGIIIDSFFSGYAGYMTINESRNILGFSDDIVNIIMLKIKLGAYEGIKEDLNNITNTIGENFTYLKLDDIFHDNLNFLSNLSIYPLFLIIFVSMLAIISLYNYQKAGIMEKAKDFLIMRAIGSKTRSLKKILFLESLFVLIPSLLLSLGIGMIINSLFLFGRVYLPPLYIPFIVFLILFIIFMISNFLSLFPIIKKINHFSIKDFSMY
ncbi:MAG: FtsX-like permease family protein [Promethearchaeota archaeon]|nr:MAG: FtsX-like permease family protein [Candidatus Lokiarchaeota archaeon]